MERFVFRLERVLRYREHLEKEARQELRKARETRASRERAWTDANLRRCRAAKRCEEKEEQGMEVAAYHLYRTFIRQVSGEMEEADQRLRGAEEEVRSMEKAWMRASSNRKALENLRERQSSAHRDLQEKEEQKLLDELVVLRRRLA
jgi:flagellar FliJ protein